MRVRGPYIVGIPPRLRPSQVILYSTFYSIIYAVLHTMKGWWLRAPPPACFRLASGSRPGTFRDQGSTSAAGESASLPSLQGHLGFRPTRFAVKEWRVQ